MERAIMVDNTEYALSALRCLSWRRGVRSLMKTTVPAILFMIILILCTGCTQSTAPPAAGSTPAITMVAPISTYINLTPAQAKDLIAGEEDLVIVDVSPAYDDGHLPGAISIPLDTLDSKISMLDKTKPYLVYCHGDAPSIAGAQKLVDAGFPRVYRLEGNYAAWVGAGYMVDKIPVTLSPIVPSMIPPAVAGKYTDLTPALAKDLITENNNLVIVDVSPYYANGHLPGAISIPLDTLDSKISMLDKTKTYLVYCHGDVPSIAGAQKLVDAGFPRVYRLEGNYAAWVSAGYMVSV